MSNIDPDSLNIPAFIRKKNLNKRAKDKLLNTAYDYKQAGLLAKLAKDVSKTKPLIKAKPARSWPLLDEYERPIKKARSRIFEEELFEEPKPKKRRTRVKKMSQAFEPPLLEIANEVASEPSYSYERKRGGITKIAPIGIVSDYLANIEVGIIELEGILREGDIVQIECENGMFQQTADSMQINRKQVKIARKGVSIGLKLVSEPEVGGRVFKII